MIKSSSHPPFFGRCKDLWDALKPSLKPTGKTIPFLQPRERSTFFGEIDSKFIGGRSVEMATSSLTQRALSITIMINYPNIGYGERSYLPLTIEDLEEAFESYAIGWPNWLYYLSRAFWAHHNQALWVKEESCLSFIKREIIKHRLCDLLGALSLISHEVLPAGLVTSRYAGHKFDLKMIKKTKI